MKITVLFALFVTIGVTAAARPASAGVEISFSGSRDKSLLAEYFFIDDGCNSASTSIRYAQGVTWQNGPPVVSPPTTLVTVTYTDTCTGESHVLEGGTTQQVVTIASDLSGASLSAVVPVTDGVWNANVTINATWTANAPLQQSKESTRTFDRVARTITWDRFNFSTRSADVAGNVSTVVPATAGPTFLNLSLDPRGGNLGKNASGTRTIVFLPGHH